jgi:oxidoreductase
MERKSSPAKMNAFVLGGTGMVGKHLTNELLQSEKFLSVTLFTRRELKESEKQLFNSDKLKVQIVDFDALEKNIFKGMDIGFCTLGTTKADAGSAEAFIKIDHDIPLKAATLFKEQLAGKDGYFSLLTSTGSNKDSWFLYPRTKGLLEQDIINLGFKQVSIFRPGLLFLEGEDRPKPRFFEGVAIGLSNLLGNRYGGSPITGVAKAMRVVAESIPKEPVTIYENNDIWNLFK